MKNKRHGKIEKGGLYIALCCFAVIAAVVGYAGTKKDDTGSNKHPIKTEELSKASSTPENSPSLNGKVTIEVKDEQPEKTQTQPPAKPAPKAESNDESVSVSKNVKLEVPVFKAPVKGKTASAFTGDKLVYNEALSDWRTHNGIDILCDENAAIHAASDGIVSEVYESAQGKSIKIDHTNGYVSVYSNLSDTIEVITGDEVKTGDIIAKAGSSSIADFTSEPHLHFEILLNGEFVNPSEYIN